MTHKIVMLTEHLLAKLPEQEKKYARTALTHLNRWKGNMAVDSTGATVYMYWLLEFSQTLFHK